MVCADPIACSQQRKEELLLVFLSPRSHVLLLLPLPAGLLIVKAELATLHKTRPDEVVSRAGSTKEV